MSRRESTGMLLLLAALGACSSNDERGALFEQATAFKTFERGGLDELRVLEVFPQGRCFRIARTFVKPVAPHGTSRGWSDGDSSTTAETTMKSLSDNLFGFERVRTEFGPRDQATGGRYTVNRQLFRLPYYATLQRCPADDPN